jgi:hypothetical protein
MLYRQKSLKYFTSIKILFKKAMQYRSRIKNIYILVKFTACIFLPFYKIVYFHLSAVLKVKSL